VLSAADLVWPREVGDKPLIFILVNVGELYRCRRVDDRVDLEAALPGEEELGRRHGGGDSLPRRGQAAGKRCGQSV